MVWQHKNYHQNEMHDVVDEDDDDGHRIWGDFVMTTPYQLNGTLVKDTDKYKKNINKKSVYVITSDGKQNGQQ